MPDNALVIRTMTYDQIQITVEWAAREGWNPGINDARCYHLADPDGFLMGFRGEDPVSSISVVKYDETFAFLGFYIVKPEYRGRGLGLKTWNAGLKYLEGCNIGLDGVVAQQDNYKKSGFQLAWKNRRYQGTAGAIPSPCPDIIPLCGMDFDSLLSYDLPFFPPGRPSFIKAWITQPGAHSLGILRDGCLAGYGVTRPCRIGYKIGPLYVDDPDLADVLFSHLRASVPEGQPVFLDVPETNPHALRLAERHGMSVVFETARMYSGEIPKLPLRRLFGVTSFEIG